MSRITVECPDCKKEHVINFHGDGFLAGGIGCDCGAQFRFTFYRPTAVYQPNYLPQRGVFTND